MKGHGVGSAQPEGAVALVVCCNIPAGSTCRKREEPKPDAETVRHDATTAAVEPDGGASDPCGWNVTVVTALPLTTYRGATAG